MMSASFSLSGKCSFNNALLKLFCKSEIVDFEQCFNVFESFNVFAVFFSYDYLLFCIRKRSFLKREIKITTINRTLG